jgi:hypothetical protein
MKNCSYVEGILRIRIDSPIDALELLGFLSDISPPSCLFYFSSQFIHKEVVVVITTSQTVESSC